MYLDRMSCNINKIKKYKKRDMIYDVINCQFGRKKGKIQKIKKIK